MGEDISALSKEKFLAGNYTDVLLDVGATLLSSGAHSERINRNLLRMGHHWGYDIDILFSYTSLLITIQKKDDPAIYATRHKRVAAHGVNFGILTDVSLLSWRVTHDRLSPEDVAAEMEHIKKTNRYEVWKTGIAVGLACAALCIIAKGNAYDAAFALVAAMAGYVVRHAITSRKYNAMIGVLAASFVTSMIAGMDMLFHIGISPEKALATAVLYLIPGVPLINCVIDLIEGYIPTALSRGMLGGFILLCIALGMSLSILFIGIHKY